MRASDTHPDAERFLVERVRTLPAWRKVRMVVELTEACERMARAGVRDRHPGASEREIRLRLAAQRFDRATMIRVFGWDPAVHGL